MSDAHTDVDRILNAPLNHESTKTLKDGLKNFKINLGPLNLRPTHPPPMERMNVPYATDPVFMVPPADVPAYVPTEYFTFGPAPQAALLDARRRFEEFVVAHRQRHGRAPSIPDQERMFTALNEYLRNVQIAQGRADWRPFMANYGQQQFMQNPGTIPYDTWPKFIDITTTATGTTGPWARTDYRVTLDDVEN